MSERIPCHVQQPGDTEIFDRTEEFRSAVEQRRQTGDGGKQMRNDTQGAAESGREAPASSGSESGGDGVERPGAGGEYNQQ